jgi:5'-nucleotidase
VKGQGVTIALQNGGGLRASIGAGQVSMGDVLAVLPFQNTLATFNLPGSAIVAALENGVSQVEEGGGRFPQVAGLRFAWDPSVPPMEGRIASVEVREGDAWVPLDPAKVYAVASNNFMRNGGDGYTSLRDQATNAYDFGPGLEGVLADYLAARPGYEPYTDGRIRLVE